jgi:integrase
MKGHLRERGKGNWWAVVDIGNDPVTGKRRQKWHKLTSMSKKKAQDELNKLLTDMSNGTYVLPSSLTVGEYLERWLQDYARINTSERTFEWYQLVVRVHLSKSLGDIPLHKLTPLDIQGHYSRALNGENGRRALSARSVLHHHRILREALQQAVRWRLLTINPADGTEPPRPRAKEMSILTPEQSSALIEGSRGHRLHLPIVLALGAGLRKGEIFGLQWKDIDFTSGIAHIRRSLEPAASGPHFKEPKTAKGRRSIALPSFALEALRQHRVQQAELRLQIGPDYNDLDLVCCLPDGRPVVYNLVRDFQALLKRLGLPKVRFHDLRHSHASLLLAQGIHPKVVSERLGHSQVGITLDTYSHLLPNLQQEAAAKLDSLLKVAGNGRS